MTRYVEELGQIELARAERERRDEVARQEAEEQRRQEALGEARTLQGERQAATRAIDRYSAKLMAAIAAYVSACSGQQRAFKAAGLSQASGGPRVYVVEGALTYARRQADVPFEFLSLPPVSDIGPAAERDPNLVEA